MRSQRNCLTNRIRIAVRAYPEWKSAKIAEALGCNTRQVTEVRSRLLRGYYHTRSLQNKTHRMERQVLCEDLLINGDFP